MNNFSNDMFTGDEPNPLTHSFFLIELLLKREFEFKYLDPALARAALSELDVGGGSLASKV